MFCTVDIGPSLGMFIQTYLWYENYGTWIFPHSKQLFECSYRPTFDVWGVESGFFHALDNGLSLEYVHTLHLSGPADVHKPLLDRVFTPFPEPVGLTATHGHITQLLTVSLKVNENSAICTKPLSNIYFFYFIFIQIKLCMYIMNMLKPIAIIQ